MDDTFGFQKLFEQLIHAAKDAVEVAICQSVLTTQGILLLLLPGTDDRAQSAYVHMRQQSSNPQIRELPPPPIPENETAAIVIRYDDLSCVPLARLERTFIDSTRHESRRGEVCVVGFVGGHILLAGVGGSTCTAPGGTA